MCINVFISLLMLILCEVLNKKMSKVLIIKHLPSTLSFKDKEQLLKHFGAENVWGPDKKRDYVFASFSNIEKAKSSLIRLHQLEIAKRRLVVEYSFENEPITQIKKNEDTISVTTNHIKDFLGTLNAWNPSIDYYQPPPVHLNYVYPKLNSQISVNILYSLFNHKPFYIQILHLMNKMCLEPPFTENDKALNYFRETFREYFLDGICITAFNEPSESELSSDEHVLPKESIPPIMKRKHLLPKTRKRAAAVLATANLPKPKKVNTNQKVFDVVSPLAEAKKISLFVSQDALQKPAEMSEIVGELGKFKKEDDTSVVEIETNKKPDEPTITRKEILKNRISYREMKVLPVFKNYHPGEPSMRLYIKNLAKQVMEQDVQRIYKRYVENIAEEEQIGFDVRVMQEGRMKGQAFVTFPSVRLAEQALSETNGFLLKEKPMVVQFARASNKKTVI